MNDNELLILLQSDHERGLEQTVRQYSAYVYKIACTRLSDVCTSEDIEEAVSDIFLAFYNVGLNNDFNFRSVQAILGVIAKRHCIDVFRKKSKSVDTVDYDELENCIAAEKDESRELLEAVKELGEPDSTIFIRKYYFGQKNIDIAKELGMSKGMINMRISRGLKKLKKILEGRE
ncbi:RNA polymerase sigma factor [Ruminococcus albus]|uniref:RNA polymerase sigma-70 factor, ECF subfamily n=1 Tax=Ruminococcus albus TaxID=1264 RepID=A0A1H7F414_RUMAL|nr:sigma-70 family RNA polymerase sigma factor [Ruminococcus albus]SEK20718.1 RNA polymerase sigma-70 factor, ECF subfamily [Ruminococcus albus]